MRVTNKGVGYIEVPINGAPVVFNPGVPVDLDDALEAAVKAAILPFADLEIVSPEDYSESVYSGVGSFQPVAPDLNLDTVSGSNNPGDPKFLAAGMGNIIGDALTKVANYMAGLIGAYSVTGVKATRYPTGGVIGIVMDTVTEVDGAVVALVDGDSGLTKGNAAFKAMMKNSTPGSGFDYGTDLMCPGVDGYLDLAILKALDRSPNEVCRMEGSGVPVDGTTGLDFAGKGSEYVDYSSGEHYYNTGTKAAPVWKVVTHA